MFKDKMSDELVKELNEYTTKQIDNIINRTAYDTLGFLLSNNFIVKGDKEKDEYIDTWFKGLEEALGINDNTEL